jgi:glycosyltransferase involved in cell wall biosynthesis
MNKPGVIQIIDSLNTGGAEVLAVNIANGLYEKGINSHLCTTRKEGLLLRNIGESVGYLFLNKKKVFDIKAIIRFKKYLKINNINIIHAHSTSVFFAFCLKLTDPRLKIIWHDHYGKSEELNDRRIFPVNVISFFLDSIISVNTNLKIWCEEKLYCKEVYFLNNFPIFNCLDKITILKGNEHKQIVHLAAFRDQKDHKNLINAFENFIIKNNDWSLHLIGPINNDDYTKEILDLIKSKGLEKYIFVYGACIDIYNILNQATIGVLSSKSEGLPIALLEYGLAKLPAVVTDVGESSAVIEDNKSGIIVKPSSFLDLSKALNILANSEEKRSDFSELFHINILKKYSKESFLNQLIKIYTL